ncbi:hypothetical protein [Halobacillus ihumii]|uniref:hypothetical protein n=1 Tax=Halobacillus ihumii TaxID=2686092 RepID=UPI0013D10852|nr:hypothetical protein [Halobacillus ihumii]
MYSKEVMERIRSALREEGSSTTDKYIESLSKVEAMDLCLQGYGVNIPPHAIRGVILEIFRINLEGISTLEKNRISVFSKGLWVSRQPKDLFVVYTGSDDIDAKVYVSDYFKEKTGQTVLPAELEKKLKSMGYKEHDNDRGALYYVESEQRAVSNSFKEQTIGAIAETVRHKYQKL